MFADMTFIDYVFIIFFLIPVFFGLNFLFDKERPESTIVRIVSSLMWILIPLIIIYYFYGDLIK